MHKCFSFIDSFYKKFYTKFYIYQINKKWQNRHHNYIPGIYLPKSLTLNLDPLHNFNTLMKWSHDDMTMKLSNTLWSCCIFDINVYKHTYTHNMTIWSIFDEIWTHLHYCKNHIYITQLIYHSEGINISFVAGSFTVNQLLCACEEIFAIFARACSSQTFLAAN